MGYQHPSPCGTWSLHAHLTHRSCRCLSCTYASAASSSLPERSHMHMFAIPLRAPHASAQAILSPAAVCWHPWSDWLGWLKGFSNHVWNEIFWNLTDLLYRFCLLFIFYFLFFSFFFPLWFSVICASEQIMRYLFSCHKYSSILAWHVWIALLIYWQEDSLWFFFSHKWFII